MNRGEERFGDGVRTHACVRRQGWVKELEQNRCYMGSDGGRVIGGCTSRDGYVEVEVV